MLSGLKFIPRDQIDDKVSLIPLVFLSYNSFTSANDVMLYNKNYVLNVNPELF